MRCGLLNGEKPCSPPRDCFSAADFAWGKTAPGAVDTAADGAEQVVKFVFHGGPVRRALGFKLLHAHLGTGHLLLELADERQNLFLLLKSAKE